MILQNESTIQNLAESIKVYPVFKAFSPLAQTTVSEDPTPSISNITLSGDNLMFDLNLEETGFQNYRNIKVLCLDQAQINTFQQFDFPNVLAGTPVDIFFKNKPGESVFAPKPSINKITLDLKNKNYSNELKVFIVYQLGDVESGQIFLSTIEKKDIFIADIKMKEPKTLIKKLNIDKGVVAALKAQEIISNLYLSYSSNGNASGFFAVDVEKIIKKNTAFPSLIDPNNSVSVGTFLNSVQVYMTKYNTGVSTLLTDETYGPFAATTVKNLFVENDSGKMFFEFMARDVSNLLTYKVDISLNIKDPTITLAKGVLKSMLGAISNNERTTFFKLGTRLYGRAFKKEFFVSMEQLDLMSVSDFNRYANKVVYKIRKDLENTEKRTLYKNSDKNFMNPSPANFSFLQAPIIQTIKRKINFNQNKQNSIVSLKQSFPFKRTVINSVDDVNTTVSEITTKSFFKINNLETINSFKIFVDKDKKNTTSNLNPEINCSNQRTLIVQPEEIKTMPLSTTKDSMVDIFYLDRVGDSVSALIFEKLNQASLDAASAEQKKIFARLVNYDDYYNSYFYIQDNGEA